MHVVETGPAGRAGSIVELCLSMFLSNCRQSVPTPAINRVRPPRSDHMSIGAQGSVG